MKVLRNWFYTTSGDAKVNGFWTRFLGNGISKPTQATFENLTDSVAFHTEVNSAAQPDTAAALQDKQGLVILSADVNALSRSNTPLGATGGALAVRPSQLTSVSPVTDLSPVEDMPATLLSATVDPSVTTRNNYLLNLTTGFKNWLISRTFKTGGSLGQVPVKSAGSNYQWVWGNEYRSTSTTSVTIPTVLPTSVSINVTSPSDTLSYAPGVRVRISDANNPLNYVEGEVQSYNTQTLIFNADNVGGSGSINNWTVNLGGGQPKPVLVTNPQLWVSSDSGDDTLGDGSINKPYKTFSKIVTVLQMIADNDSTASVTVMVVGGTYNNSTNLVVSTAFGDGYFAYTINCFPGVIINQTTNSLINNQSLAGHVNIFGQPNINGSSLGVNHLLDIKARRRGPNFTTTYLQLGEVRISDTSLPIRILSRGNGALGPSRVQLNIGFVRTFYNDYVILIDGQDNQVALKAEAITNAGAAPVCAIQIGGSGQLGVTSSGFSINIEDTLIQDDRTNANGHAVKIAALPGRDVSYTGTEQDSFTAGILVNRLSHYIRGSGGGSGSSTFDIRGLGSGSNVVFIKDCRTMKGGSALGNFLLGSGVGDSVCAIDNISQITASTSATVAAFGSLPTITTDSKGAYFINLFDY